MSYKELWSWPYVEPWFADTLTTGLLFSLKTINDIFPIFRFNKSIIHKRILYHHCEFESGQALWILPCEEAMQLVYGKLLFLLWCLYLKYCTKGHQKSSSCHFKSIVFLAIITETAELFCCIYSLEWWNFYRMLTQIW